VELFSKRNELIDTLSEERESTPEEERRIAHQEQYVKSDRFIHLDASHATTEQAKLEEEQLLNLVRGGWDTCESIAGAGKSHLLKEMVGAAFARGKSVVILSPTDASVGRYE
jgi:primosomal protein N'